MKFLFFCWFFWCSTCENRYNGAILRPRQKIFWRYKRTRLLSTKLKSSTAFFQRRGQKLFHFFHMICGCGRVADLNWSQHLCFVSFGCTGSLLFDPLVLFQRNWIRSVFKRNELHTFVLVCVDLFDQFVSTCSRWSLHGQHHNKVSWFLGSLVGVQKQICRMWAANSSCHRNGKRNIHHN